MEDLAIPVIDIHSNSLFDANAYLDEDGDLRLALTFLTNEKEEITVKTGKIKIEDVSYELGFENLMQANITIHPDKSNNLFTVETYE